MQHSHVVDHKLDAYSSAHLYQDDSAHLYRSWDAITRFSFYYITAWWDEQCHDKTLATNTILSDRCCEPVEMAFDSKSFDTRSVRSVAICSSACCRFSELEIIATYGSSGWPSAVWSSSRIRGDTYTAMFHGGWSALVKLVSSGDNDSRRSIPFLISLERETMYHVAIDLDINPQLLQPLLMRMLRMLHALLLHFTSSRCCFPLCH